MNKKKVFVGLLAGALSVGLLTACGGPKTDETGDGQAAVKIWTGTPAVMIDGYNSAYDTPGFKKMEEELGVKIEYVYPTAGQEWEQFNLMLASGEFPDAINFWWGQVPGGVEKLINSGTIYGMDDEFLQTNAPDFYKLLQENEVYERGCKTDSGVYYQFPKFFDYQEGQDEPLYTNGYFMRADWLKELNLEVPETLDEWHTALTAFKDQKGAEAPLTGTNLPKGLEGAFGIGKEFYHDGDVIKFGPYEDNYKEFLTTMNQWYSEGLIDQNLVGITSKQVNSKILNGRSGASWGYMGSDFGAWMNAASGSFDMVGVQIPVKNKGDISEYSIGLYPVYGSGAVISNKTKDPALVAKVLNFGFTEKGHMLANFGIEGESYTMQDGNPVYTDKVLHDPNGLSVSKARDVYCESPGGIFREDYRYIQQYYNLPQQKQAQETWRKGNGNAHVMPELSFSEAEASERSKIVTETKSYIEEMTSKFVMGIEPLDKFEEYRAHLKDLGIEKAISITQDAYNRYLNR